MLEGHHLHVVHSHATMVDTRLSQVHGHTRVVELAVVIYDTALQTFLHPGGQTLHHALGGNELGAAVTETEGEDVIECQATEIEEVVPVAIVGDHEGLVFHQMRRIGLHAATFAQCLEHQHHVALLQVTYTAVHELCATARRTLGKVVLLQNGYLIAARGCIYGAAQTCGTATHYDKVPHHLCGAKAVNLSFTFHCIVCLVSVYFLTHVLCHSGHNGFQRYEEFST